MNTDPNSTTDPTASMVAVAAAINSKTNHHSVIAIANPTVLDFAVGNYTADALVAGNLVINGVDIVGVPAAASCDALVALIGDQVPGVVALNNGGQLRLAAADGRNIQVATNGNAASMTFANFHMTGVEPFDRVKRGQISLTTIFNDNQGITIGGNNPGKIGLAAGTLAGIYQYNSDNIRVSLFPGTGATSPQAIDLDLSDCTQVAAAFAVLEVRKDGYGAGNLTRIDIRKDGLIIARYNNDQSQLLGQVIL